MTTSRRHVSLKTKLAAALRELGRIPYDDAKRMSEEQVLSLFHWDHGILHAIEPNNEHWNLTPRFIGEHRIKTKTDVKKIAKVRRIEAKWNPFMSAMAAGIKPQRKPPSRWPKRSFQRRAK